MINTDLYLALKVIEAQPKEHRHEYQYADGRAPAANENLERSAFFKLRSLSILFKLRKVPRAQLIAICATLEIEYIDLMCHMPIQWNSTDKC
jgi:hypothetical protein